MKKRIRISIFYRVMANIVKKSEQKPELENQRVFIGDLTDKYFGHSRRGVGNGILL